MCYNGVGSAPLSLPQIPQLPVRRHTFIVADRRQVCYLLFWLCKKIYNCRLTERAPGPWVLESIFLGLVGLAQTSDEETKQYSYQECGDHYSSTYFRCANFLILRLHHPGQLRVLGPVMLHQQCDGVLYLLADVCDLSVHCVTLMWRHVLQLV